MTRRFNIPVRALLASTTVAVAVSMGGCAAWKADDSEASQLLDTAELRRAPSVDNPGIFGVSNKARQIERNLGVQ